MTLKKYLPRFSFILLLQIISSFYLHAGNQYYNYDSIGNELEKIIYLNKIESKITIKKWHDLAQNTSEKERMNAFCLYWESNMNYAHGINDTELIDRIDSCLNHLNETNYPFEKALLQHAIALGYISKGDYGEAFSFGLKAYDRFKELKNDKFIVRSLMLLGYIFTNTKNFKMAEDYFKQALKILDQSQIEYYGTLINIYTLKSYAGNTKEAIAEMESLLPKLEKMPDNKRLLIVIYTNLSSFYASLDEMQKSLDYFHLAQNSMVGVDNNRLRMSLIQNMGYFYIKQKDFKQAKYYFDTSRKIASEDENPRHMFLALYGLTNMYEQMGNSDSAFVYLKECYKLQTQLSNNPKTIETYQAYFSALLDSSTKGLKIAEQEVSLKNKQFIIIIISSLVIVLLALLFLIILQHKKKLKEAENRDMEERLQHEMEIKQIQEEDIESKIRQITSYSLMLLNKNQILQQISDTLKQPVKTYEESLKKNDRMAAIIKSNLNVDNDWNDFRIYFDQVHPRFFDTLKSLCEDLTENNLRMCAYFRLGLPTKQIAQILNILPDAVLRARWRLKKKFNLSENERLDDFLRRF